MSEDSISWVQLSDLHLTSKPDEKQGDILQALKSSLLNLKTPDLLLVTGDIVLGNLADDPMSDQYLVAQDFLNEITEGWKLDRSRVFVVPGNHDVNRNRVTEGNKAYIDSILNDSHSVEKKLRELWHSADDAQKEQRIDISRGLTDYMKFLQDMKYEHLFTGNDQLGYYARMVNLNGVSIGIAGFSTAWSSYRNNEKGRLLFGIEQAVKAEREIGTAQIRIALAHHPFHWLNGAEEETFRRKLGKNYHFFLHGHEHYADLSQKLIGNIHYRIGAGAARQDEGEVMCFYKMELPIKSGPANMGFYYRVPIGEGCEFHPSNNNNPVITGLNVSQLIGKEPEPKVAYSLKLRPPVQPTPVQGQADRPFNEFRYGELLAPILRELKKMLQLSEMAILFLPPRKGSIVPELDSRDYDNYDKIRESLLNQSAGFRKPKVSRAIVCDKNGSISFLYDEPPSPALVPWKAVLAQTSLSWEDQVTTPLSVQIMHWAEKSHREIVCSLKYISSPDNRDVIGYIASAGQSTDPAKPIVAKAIANNAERLIQDQLMPALRHLLLDVTERELQKSDSRITILDTILEAAVSLSGADWGCIKSSTLGAATVESKNENEKCELVQAVCVHNCPRFFHEGRLIETEELVATAVRQNQDKVLNLSAESKKLARHPASQMAVFLIRDKERIIEPQLPDSDVVGTIVIQHTAPGYLEQYHHVYSSFLRELADLTSRTTRTAASKSLVSILKRGVSGELDEAFTHKISQVVNWIASGKEATWVLLQPNGSSFGILKSPNTLDGLQDVLIELIGAEKPVNDQSRLAAFVCNSTMSFQLQMLHHTKRPIQIGRVGITEFGANAYFDQAYKDEVNTLRSINENQVLFNLGRERAWYQAESPSNARRYISLAIGPIVSPTGRPVGVLAVLKQVNMMSRPWDIERLKSFEKNLSSLRDDLYVSQLNSARSAQPESATTPT
jgi:predicted MPP superfamily phosphohydrolase